MLADLQIKEFASQLRELAGLPLDEPVGDIKEILSKADYIYSEKPLPRGYAAESRIDKTGFHITFNSELNFGEKFHRFTIGHELGHWNIPPHFEKLQEIKLHRSFPECSSAEEIEREADRFSIFFLAPENAYQKQMMGKDFSIHTVNFLSDYFIISQYAAVLHYMDLTDLSCSLIVCNQKFEIDWERRSNRMHGTFKMERLKKKKLPETTMAYECIKKTQSCEPVSSLMSDWYSDFPHKMNCSESVLYLDYNKKYLVFLTPEYADYNDFLSENDCEY